MVLYMLEQASEKDAAFIITATAFIVWAAFRQTDITLRLLSSVPRCWETQL